MLSLPILFVSLSKCINYNQSRNQSRSTFYGPLTRPNAIGINARIYLHKLKLHIVPNASCMQMFLVVSLKNTPTPQAPYSRRIWTVLFQVLPESTPHFVRPYRTGNAAGTMDVSYGCNRPLPIPFSGIFLEHTASQKQTISP